MLKTKLVSILLNAAITYYTTMNYKIKFTITIIAIISQLSSQINQTINSGNYDNYNKIPNAIIVINMINYVTNIAAGLQIACKNEYSTLLKLSRN